MITLLLLISSLNCSDVYAIDISAESAVLYEPVTERLIYSKNENKKMSMASTTKIATCITAIENADLSDIVTVSKNADDTEGSSVWLEAGETMTVKNLLYGLMLASGNDAAVAIAEHIGGNVNEFSKYMNETAYKAGANNTNFTNPSGLDDENHYTTSIDLAKITAYALKNPVFSNIVSTYEKTIPWEGHEWDRKIKNHNKLLKMYDGCIGVKTGFTKKSGRCLVSAAERNGITLIAVTLKAPDDWNDHIKMLDYGFSVLNNNIIVEKGRSAGKVAVTGGVQESINCFIGETYTIPVMSSDKIKTDFHLAKKMPAPVKANTIIGYVDIYLNDKKINRVDLLAESDCDKKFIPTFNYYVKILFENMLKNKNVVLIQM